MSDPTGPSAAPARTRRDQVEKRARELYAENWPPGDDWNTGLNAHSRIAWRRAAEHDLNTREEVR